MRIALPKTFLIRLSKDLYEDKNLNLEELRLNESETEYVREKYGVDIESQATSIVKQIHDSVHGIHLITLHMFMVYNYNEKVGREVCTQKDRHVFCIFVFMGEDKTSNVACDMDVALDYPYGKPESPNVHPESHLARLKGIAKTKKYLSRHVGVHSGFAQQIKRVRNHIRAAVYGASKTACNYCDFVFTGHGIGGALALLSAMEAVCIAQLDYDCDPAFTVISYGAPRPGNCHIKTIVEKSKIKVKRYVAYGDDMPRLPPKSSSASSGFLCVGGSNVSSREKYVHPCGKRRPRRFAMMCASRDTMGIGQYFRLFKTGMELVQDTAALAEEIAEVL